MKKPPFKTPIEKDDAFDIVDARGKVLVRVIPTGETFNRMVEIRDFAFDAMLAALQPPIVSISKREYDWRACQKDGQESDSQPVFYTHFDCWNSDESDERKWAERSFRATLHIRKLLNQWARDAKLPALRKLAEKSSMLGEAATFELAAEFFIQAGYRCYYSDTMFEVYLPQ